MRSNGLAPDMWIFYAKYFWKSFLFRLLIAEIDLIIQKFSRVFWYILPKIFDQKLYFLRLANFFMDWRFSKQALGFIEMWSLYACSSYYTRLSAFIMKRRQPHSTHIIWWINFCVFDKKNTCILLQYTLFFIRKWFKKKVLPKP